MKHCRVLGGGDRIRLGGSLSMTNVRELCGEVAFILIEGAPACAAKVGADDICKIAQTAATTTRPCLCRRVNFHGTKNQNFICMYY